MANPFAFLHWSAAPADITPTQRQNFINVQIDAIGIGLVNAAAPFLPVFLTRLGASNFQVGLLTSMPALTGLLFGVLVGRFLQSRRNVVPWFSGARFVSVSAYALTGLIPFIVPAQYAIPAVLIIWAAVTLPQTTVNVAFSVVMNAVAGPKHRYDLMSRRWSILGLTSALTVSIVGQMLERLAFPVNYQLAFVALSVGGLISLIFSSRIQIPEQVVIAASASKSQSLLERLRGYVRVIGAHPDFVSFTAKRFVFLSGIALGTPLFPLYLVRQVQASDVWIGLISTTQTFVLVIGYLYWTRQSRRRGSRFVLAWTTFGLALYPALVAATPSVQMIAVLSGLAGIFQAGLDLVFFDELMKTVPPEQTATFVSLAQSLQYLSAVVAPLAGTFLADHIGLSGALLVSAALRLAGWAWFAWTPRKPN